MTKIRVSRVSVLLNTDRPTSVRMTADTLNIPKQSHSQLDLLRGSARQIEKKARPAVPGRQAQPVNVAPACLQSPADFILFPRIKTTLTGARFENIQAIPNPYDEGSERGPRRRHLPECVPCTEKSLAKVRERPREVLRRVLNVRNDIFSTFFFFTNLTALFSGLTLY